jgi:hypothetical protein
MTRLAAVAALAALVVLAGVWPGEPAGPREDAAAAAYRSSRALCARAGAAILWDRYGPASDPPAPPPSRADAIEAYAGSRYRRGSEAFAAAVRGCSETLHE